MLFGIRSESKLSNHVRSQAITRLAGSRPYVERNPEIAHQNKGKRGQTEISITSCEMWSGVQHCRQNCPLTICSDQWSKSSGEGPKPELGVSEDSLSKIADYYCEFKQSPQVQTFDTHIIPQTVLCLFVDTCPISPLSRYPRGRWISLLHRKSVVPSL